MEEQIKTGIRKLVFIIIVTTVAYILSNETKWFGDVSYWTILMITTGWELLEHKFVSIISRLRGK